MRAAASRGQLISLIGLIRASLQKPSYQQHLSTAAQGVSASATREPLQLSYASIATVQGRALCRSREQLLSCSYHSSPAAQAQPARQAAASSATRRKGRSNAAAAQQLPGVEPAPVPSTSSDMGSPAAMPEAAGSSEAAAGSQAQVVRAKTGGRYQLPPTPGQQMLKQAPISTNLLAEPYRGDPPPLPLSSWVTLAGYKERWRRTVSGMKSMYTLAKCRKHIAGFSLPGFKAEALVLYEEVCRAVAADDKSLLRQRLTPVEYSNVKAQLRARAAGGWARVAWALARRPELHQLELLHARLMSLNPKDDKAAFAQLTVRVRAAHRFAAYDAAGRAAAGDESREVPVQDVWVFERFLTPGPTSRWRVAGRLSLPPAPPPTERWWNPLGWLQRLRPPAASGAAALQP